MDEIFRDFLVTFTIVAAIFGMVYIHYMTRHRERLAMMEKGLAPSELSSRKDSRWISLKYGMLLVGVAVGMLVGNVVYETYELSNIVAYLSMTLLWGGLSLVFYFIIEGKYKK